MFPYPLSQAFGVSFNIVQVTLAIQLTYYTLVCAIKVSILSMYLRFRKSSES